jgi:hypothetical protein
VAPLTAPLKSTSVELAVLQTAWVDGVLTVGVGLTVTVKVWAVPLQPFAEGVTEKSPDMAEVPLLVAVKAEMLPLPDPAVPIAVLSFDQA